MEGVQVSHMNGGIGEKSYAHNSLLQKKTLEMTQVIKEEAIRKIYNRFTSSTFISIADLGCSSGPNTLFAIHQLVNTICKIHREHSKDESRVNIQVFLNDLPGNDFNSIFTEFPSFKKQLKREIGDGIGSIFIHGVPGSFHEELFQPNTLHFVHSSFSLHWLSQGLIDEEKWDGFNIPLYTPSPMEIKMEVGKETSFQMNCLEVSKVEWEASTHIVDGELGSRAHPESVVNCMRAVAEPMLVDHFGEGLMDEVFRRYCEALGDIMANDEKPFFTNITVSLAKTI